MNIDCLTQGGDGYVFIAHVLCFVKTTNVYHSLKMINDR